MGLSKFDWISWLIGAGATGIIFFVGGGLCLPLVGSLSDGVFCFDVLSFYFMGLSLVLGLSLIFWQNCFSGASRFMIFLSLCCSLLSYSCVHSLGFWVFYEGAILPLLFLLIRESPYSERYVASWYLLGYVVLTSLPMLLCLFYLSVEAGSFSLCHWGEASLGGFSVILLLSVLFITKIPLPPFHVWLPIVHAEASSPVSVCLSGYIMKLGLLGVYRFCSWLLPNYVFSVFYVGVCVAIAFLFFFSASRELDGKRWLAFMSLSHILVPALCLCVSGFNGLGISFLYCLGHGASAGATFLFLWLIYEVSGSRNWAVLKFGLSSSLLMRFLAGACFCTVASIPPTVQFFCEVHTLWEAGAVAACFVFGVFCYLFCGGLVPIFVLGGVLSRHYSISFGSGSIFMGLCSVFFLLMWSFVLFLVG
uniref:NADH dehydrogenase subunit 4 n=1 Tax=Paragonimus skrjabini miyazakii TaxID=59628 RepID=UPI0021D532CC|nr:NADH dehydrogenase subunit 4 [Paragonimus skrjabini miyazakii]UXE35006.1 NADH dehydrogenase subunit 4 [Paragonimus skrjabini miyazakii]